MLTVLMATRNRAQILANVLAAYCRLQRPSSGWKLVVVDNDSTDETAQVVVSFANRLPLQLLVEAQLGKNHALNAGLAMVEGDLTVLTDDDVFPNADWLLQFRQAADRHPESSMFGGAILPRWEVNPPTWIRYADLGPVYALTDPSWQDGPVNPELIFGPNMAIRASVFQSGNRFDPSIGPRGSSYPMGSETEFTLRLARQGHKAWYVPDAVVEHFIRAEQLKEEWCLQRAIRFGRGQYRLFPDANPWLGIPRRIFRDLPKEALVIAVAWASFRQKALFRSRWRFNVLRGMAIEARILARERQ